MNDLDGNYKLIQFTKFTCFSVNKTVLQKTNNHYSKGSTFVIERISSDSDVEKNYLKEVSSQLILVAEGNHLKLVQEEEISNYNLIYSESIEEYPRSGMFYIKTGQKYLDDSLNFQNDRTKAIILILDPEIEPSNESFIDQIIGPDHTYICNIQSDFISADGVDIFHPNAKFWLKLMEQGGNDGYDEFNNEIIFSDIEYNGGKGIQFILKNNQIYIFDCDIKKYFAISEYYQTIYFSINLPESFPKLVPVSKGIFALSNGDGKFFHIIYVKCTCGLSELVEDINEASLFQFVCTGYA